MVCFTVLFYERLRHLSYVSLPYFDTVRYLVLRRYINCTLIMLYVFIQLILLFIISKKYACKAV